jgi:hypothetical protein
MRLCYYRAGPIEGLNFYFPSYLFLDCDETLQIFKVSVKIIHKNMQ